MGRWTAGSVRNYLRKPGAHKWIYFSYQNFPEIALIGKVSTILIFKSEVKRQGHV